MLLPQIVVIIAGVLSALIAGLLYGFSVSVVPGLRMIDAKAHVAAMQAINRAIINPAFILSFMGPTVLLPLAAFLYRENSAFPLLLAAAILHIVGVNGVTIAGNVPLNDRLEKVDLATQTDEGIEHERTAYHGRGSRWMVFHHIRTICSILATALAFAACFSA